MKVVFSLHVCCENVILCILCIFSPVPPFLVTISVEIEMRRARVTFIQQDLVHGSEVYQVNYGTTTDLGQTSLPVNVNMGSSYTIYITDLLPATTYYYVLQGQNDIGTTFSAVDSFTTPEDGKEVVFFRKATIINCSLKPYNIKGKLLPQILYNHNIAGSVVGN